MLKCKKYKGFLMALFFSFLVDKANLQLDDI